VGQQINNFRVRRPRCVEYKLKYKVYTIIQSYTHNYSYCWPNATNTANQYRS